MAQKVSSGVFVNYGINFELPSDEVLRDPSWLDLKSKSLGIISRYLMAIRDLTSRHNINYDYCVLGMADDPTHSSPVKFKGHIEIAEEDVGKYPESILVGLIKECLENSLNAREVVVYCGH